MKPVDPRRAARLAALLTTLRLLGTPVRLRPAELSDAPALAAGLGCTPRELLRDVLRLCRRGAVRARGDVIELVPTTEETTA